MNKTFKDHCLKCKKETIHQFIGFIPGHEATGLEGSYLIICTECNHTFWT
jgi:hypothetical protein